MRNRAKCLNCDDIIESIDQYDLIKCSCESIFVDGGKEYQRLGYKDITKIKIINDNDEEISLGHPSSNLEPTSLLKLQDKESKPYRPSRQELIEMLDEFIRKIEEMPPQAMVASISHYDLLSVLLMFSALFKSTPDCETDS